MLRFRLFPALIGALVLFGCAEPDPAATAPAACELELVERVDTDRAMDHIRFLAEDIGPRVASSPAEREAAEYLADELRSYGYEVEIQEFPRTQVVSRLEISTPEGLRIHPATGRVQEVPADEYPLLTPADGIRGRIVDCGDGSCPAEVEGAIALLHQGDEPAGPLLSRAADAGAAAAILHGEGWRRHVTSVAAEDDHLPFVTVNEEAAEALREAGEVIATLRIERFETSQNVIATRRGATEDAPVVIFSAHYDSVEQAPGANDNASGTSGLLEMARIYADVDTDLELRFAAVGAEETGLVGSRFYVAELDADDLDRIVANFNTDMIGTAGELQTQLFVNTLDGDNLVARSARVARELLGLPEEIMRAPYQRGASDHVAFHDAGIPAANFIWRDPETIDLEPWYHQPHDRPDRISEERLRTAISVVLAASQQVICETGAFRDELPATPEVDTAGGQTSSSSFDPGTEADREALFEFLVESTMAWDAFASLPDHPVHRAHPAGIDVASEMERYRQELIEADTDEKLWIVLHRISNVRRDPHLQVGLVDGGLELPDSLTLGIRAPIRFTVDYADLEDRFFFVEDWGEGLPDRIEGRMPALGDRLVAVNGRSAGAWVEAMRPYQRHATENGLWIRLANEITRTRNHVPHSEFYDPGLERLELELESREGERYTVGVPYLEPGDIRWEGHGDRHYPGFSHVPELEGFETYDLYLPDDEGLPVILLQWHRFDRDLPEAIDALMDYAAGHDLLDRHVIVDATRSGGGSRGSYALRRLQPEPHRGTFGNLKVSEAMERWVEDRIERFHRGEVDPATEDDGTWQLEWLEEDVRLAIAEGREYTSDVPFKGAHAPKWADGIIKPAEVHFTGGLTVWLSPHGGSHLDQFAAQVVDNDVAHLMGMATGGFSNTWQTTETLRFPTDGRPIVSYQWSLGHSLRPNGQILQYNPAEPHESIPQTRDNHFDYHAGLLRRTLDRIGPAGTP